MLAKVLLSLSVIALQPKPCLSQKLCPEALRAITQIPNARKKGLKVLPELTRDSFSGLQLGDVVFVWAPRPHHNVHSAAEVVAFVSDDHVITRILDLNPPVFVASSIWELRLHPDRRPLSEELVSQKFRMPLSFRLKRAYQTTSKAKQEPDYPWNIDGYQPNAFDHYDAFFWKAVGERSIAAFLADRKASGLTTHVFDLFGSAVFTKELGAIDSLTGLRLENRYPNALPAEKWGVVVGDATRLMTWMSLDQQLDERNIPAFDLAIYRPASGASFMTGYRNPAFEIIGYRSLYTLFQRTFNRLRRGGVFLIDSDAIDGLFFRRQFMDLLETQKIPFEHVSPSHKSGEWGGVLKITRP